MSGPYYMITLGFCASPSCRKSGGIVGRNPGESLSTQVGSWKKREPKAVGGATCWAVTCAVTRIHRKQSTKDPAGRGMTHPALFQTHHNHGRSLGYSHKLGIYITALHSAIFTKRYLTLFP